MSHCTGDWLAGGEVGRRDRHPGRKRHPDRWVFQGILLVLLVDVDTLGRRRADRRTCT